MGSLDDIRPPKSDPSTSGAPPLTGAAFLASTGTTIVGTCVEENIDSMASVRMFLASVSSISANNAVNLLPETVVKVQSL